MYISQTLYVALKFLQLLQLIKWKLKTSVEKNVYKNNFHNTMSKSEFSLTPDLE